MNSEDDRQLGSSAFEDKKGTEAHESDETVGYKRPPRMHRFRKGKSGNPGGRPKKAKSRRELVRRVLLEKRAVDLAGNGRPLQWTIIEIVVMGVRQDALQGNLRAYRTYNDLERRFGTQDKDCKGGVIVIPTVADFDAWMKLFGPKD
jgi:Family of unknown function (DUF5681)